MSPETGHRETVPTPPVPILNAMLIADWAIREEGSGKHSLIGIFENIQARAFPCGHPTLFVYAKMTDAKGRYDFLLQLIHLDQATMIAEVALKADVPDRMMTGELVLKLNNVTFQAPGLYEFRLVANGKYVGSKTFSVVQSLDSGG